MAGEPSTHWGISIQIGIQEISKPNRRMAPLLKDVCLFGRLSTSTWNKNPPLPDADRGSGSSPPVINQRYQAMHKSSVLPPMNHSLR